jgi:hypothetical protein
VFASFLDERNATTFITTKKYHNSDLFLRVYDTEFEPKLSPRLVYKENLKTPT